MGTRFTDGELAAFIASVRIASDVPHQDFGDVGFVFEDLEDHLVLEELVAARKVIAAARAFATRAYAAGVRAAELDEALVQYDAERGDE